MATYWKCWLGSLKCLNNVVHVLGNCNILLWICFYVIKSIVNRNFLDFFSSVPWGICCVYFAYVVFYQGTASAPSTGEPTSAGTEGIGENLFSFIVGFFISPIFIAPTSLFLLLWMPYSETGPRLVDSTPPGYKPCFTHLCQSLFFLVLSFSSLSASHFLGSPLSLTSLFFIQVQLVHNGLSLEPWKEALWYLR